MVDVLVVRQKIMIQTLLRFIVLCAFLVKAHADPKLSKDQVSRIGEVVIEKSFREYRGWFDLKVPSYDAKSKAWSFPLTREHLPTTIGERIHIFQIRDEDGLVRIGSLDHHGTPEKTDPKFKMPNNVGQFIRKIVKE